MKSYIVKLKETGMYFNVEFSFYNTIERCKMVKAKKNATIFQREDTVPNKFSICNVRGTEFSLACHINNITIDMLEVESVEAPKQPLMTDRQIKQLKKENELWLSPIRDKETTLSPAEYKKQKTGKQWICATDTDSFNYFPVLESIKDCEKEGITGYKTKQAAQKHCDKLNSL